MAGGRCQPSWIRRQWLRRQWLRRQWLRRQWLRWLAAVVLVTALVGCGSSRVTDPERATTCGELVDAGRAVAEVVLERLTDRTADEGSTDGRAGGGAFDPYADVREIMRTAAFERRAADLGCGEADLRRRACVAYRGLSARADTDAARDFLAPYFAACD